MNIAYAVRWEVASIGITLLGVAHPIRENFSGVGYMPVGGSHSGLQASRKMTCGFYNSFL